MLLLALAPLSGCQDAAEPAISAPVVEATPDHRCGRGGYLRAGLFGAISATIDWDASSLDCDGMARPGARGARLRFAGHAAEIDQDLVVIIALPDLQSGTTAKELATNATIILEGEGRFFSTASTDICWTDVVRQEQMSNERFAISGKLYCIAPLVEVNGDAGISIPQLEFSGLLDWSAR